MYTRNEASRLKEEFWTAFGRYLSPALSAEGLKINWINYHTRIKDLYFRMNADKKSVSIAISFEQNDPATQQLYFDQFLQFKSLLHETLGEEWNWQLHEPVDGKTISRIYKELRGVSVYNRDQWPDIISFLKPRIIALDLFWTDAKYSFENLQ